METLKITKLDLNANNEYIGKTDVTNFYGNIEIDKKLGYIIFPTSLFAKGYIYAKAGSGIEAGWGIKAGEGIKAGSGIEAGLSITCKLSLCVKYRIFSGIAIWKKEVTQEEKTITCGKLESGIVEYGILKEIGLPSEVKEPVNLSGKEVNVTIDGKTYSAIIK